MNKVFLNQNTYDPNVNGIGEVNVYPSLTVPDQSLTIPQILDMFTRGVNLGSILKDPIGYDDPDIDDIDPTQDPAFDIVQAKQMLIETRQKIEAEKKIQEELKLQVPPESEKMG